MKKAPAMTARGKSKTISRNMRYYIMKKISLKQELIKNISLAKSVGVNNNVATTKQQAVKPNRHSLAIFTPTHSTGVNASLLSTDNVLTVYDGLIVQNTIPFWGNMYSRLVAVVETRYPFAVTSLTKQQGASIMTAFLTGILAKLSHFSPIESLVIGFIIGLPMACLVIGFLSVMGV